MYEIGVVKPVLTANSELIVAYADHYLYTLDDKSILDKYKETSNNLINHTPFFIWSSDLGQLTKLPCCLKILL